MSIKIGDKIPAVTLKTMGKEGPENITSAEVFDGKKVVLFAVPGAFTPGCSVTHLPGYVVNADKIKA
ncbi:MAG: redoxin family protein, partial [Pseudohongiella sp.]|nr:redoxin family protein [Pseudohongiella sp.]